MVISSLVLALTDGVLRVAVAKAALTFVAVIPNAIEVIIRAAITIAALSFTYSSPLFLRAKLFIADI
jgi:hypothetical protein